ncbi:uncharacterized protein LOC125650167 [Ostrea edulis]|uniref:uncharacterized protein LOC125650167 n=1 Tax=Ostrea edulis TaxID=37623 RepID=UPI0024AEF4EF|nr:uncharacterized protein LOC125650167 [Ostrea edulis]
MMNLDDFQDDGPVNPITGKRTRILTEKGHENHTTQVRKFERTLKEAKHILEEETLIFQELQDYSDVIILNQCQRRTETALSRYSKISQDFIDYLNRTNTEETLMQASTERFIRETVITKTEILPQHIQETISKAKQVDSPTPLNSEIAISQLETKPPVNTLLAPQSMIMDTKSPSVKTSKVKSPGSAANSRRSRHSSNIFSSLSSSGLIMQHKAKAEAAKAKLEFVNQEANLQKELLILTAQKEAAVAESELNAMLEEVKGSIIEDLSEIQQERTKSFVDEQNLALQSSERTPKINEYAIPPPDHVEPLEPLPGQLSFIRPIPGRVDISTLPPGQEERKYKSTPMNPRAPSFLPELQSSILNYQPAQNSNQNHGMASELTKFLLRKDLLMSRFSNFNDRPETYSLWKASFRAVTSELEVSPLEESDLLVKWLGPESAKFAQSIRTSNIGNPTRALAKIWERLEERFGAPEMVEASLKTKIGNFPKITVKDSKKLYDLYDILMEIEAVKQNPKYTQLLSYYDSSAGVIPIMNKLPTHLQGKWCDRATRYKRAHDVAFPPFSVFCDFVKDMSSMLNDPGLTYTVDSSTPSRTNRPLADIRKQPTVYTRKTEVQEDSEQGKSEKCPIHNTNHSLNKCREFLKKPFRDRKKLIRDKNICFRCCLTTTHIAKDCQASVHCNDCRSQRHATALHMIERNQGSQMQSTAFKESSQGTPRKEHGGEPTNDLVSKCTQLCGENFKGRSCSKTVLVQVFPKGQPNKAVKVYAILDDQSNKTLGTSVLFDALGVADDKFEYSLSSCAGKVLLSARRANNLCIQPCDGRETFDLPPVIECDNMPNDRSEIPTPEVARCYRHLHHIARHIPELEQSAEISLLVGRDLPEVHHVKSQAIGPRQTPFAQELPLGWVIIGEVCLGRFHASRTIQVSKTCLSKDIRQTILQPCENTLNIKEIHDSLSREKFGTDSSIFVKTRDDDKIGLSIDDREFLAIMDISFRKDGNGHWTAPLPFKEQRPILPNNKVLALKRAHSLDVSLKKNPTKRDHMVTFMKGVIDRGAAEVAPPISEGKECWYLPLFGVYHPKKPDKIRGVFDSSVVYQGISLNSVLLTGPNLTNSLLGVLLRFRRDQIAVIADIEQMFYSFYVKEEHRDFLRFLWYRNNNPEDELIDYRMRVHVFGNTPSPAVATYGLRKAVENGDRDVRDFVERNFYVDDGLVSVPTTDEAIELVKETQQVLKEQGNIRLHKIASNSVAVMNAFPTQDLEKSLTQVSIGSDALPTQQSLGLSWDLNSDTFTFNNQLEDKPFTQRGLLSTLNSLFDPMGFIAPLVITGRILARSICSTDAAWDDDLPDTYRHDWENWRQSLHSLSRFSVPRMFMPGSLSKVDKPEIHIYSDASEKAIAAVAFVKDSETGKYGFILGKTKLAPLLGHTIPRLELCAAVLATEIGDIIGQNLDIPMENVKYFTDSKVVLGYLNNNTRRFYTYVSNRVAIIHGRSHPEQWRYISTSRNPADVGTRGVPSVKELIEGIWIQGPPLSENDDDHQCARPGSFQLFDPDSDCEVRPCIKTTKNSTEELSRQMLSKFEKFSSWQRLISAITVLKRAGRAFKEKFVPSLREMWEQTREFIIKMVQRDAYSPEIQCLQQHRPLPKESPLIHLNPYLDDSRLLRVGGRLNQSDLPVELKNPVLLPKKSYLSRLLVSHYHEEVKHQGRLFTEATIRSNGYWIAGAKRLVSSVINHCVTCKRLRGKIQEQIMGNLPFERTSTGPPFSIVGVDAFGPWEVVARKTRGGLAHRKRWAILFTCMAIRAVHIEIVDEMSSSAFINALRRFVCIRGSVKEFCSDRGTNFVGALDALRVDGVYVEQGQVQDFLHKSGTIWKFNPPHASHIGGSWERMIGMARKILDAMLLQHKGQLTHEVLHTFMYEVSAIINSRPVTPISTDPDNPVIISPAMLLTQKTGFDPIPDLDDDIKNLYTTGWKRVCMLSNMFWKRWKGEYLSCLQARRKWNQQRENLKPGNVVLVRDSTTRRNQWPLALILRVFPSKDDGNVRAVEVRMVKDGKPTNLVRPISELILLLR